MANGSLNLSEVDHEEDAVTHTLTVLDGTIKAARSVRARVTFEPKEVGDFTFEARFDNLNNEGNSESLRMVAVVSSNESSQDLLQVPPRPSPLNTPPAARVLAPHRSPLHPTPYTLHPAPTSSALSPQPETPTPKPGTFSPEP